MKRLLLCSFCALALGEPASAATGTGEYVHHVDVPSAVHAKPLDRIANDVIRFSTTPALGGRAWIIELHRDALGGIGSVTFGYWGRGDWIDGGTLKVGLSLEQYDQLGAKVDGLLAHGEAEAMAVDESGHEIRVVCTDGPGFLTERRKNGKTIWMEGFCGDDHPNNAIAKLMFGVITNNVCVYSTAPEDCPKL